MKASNKFLVGFGILIFIVIAIAVALSVIGSNQPVKILPADSPEGTVQHFLLAVKDKDYAKAYDYLSPTSDQIKGNTYENWLRSVQSPRDSSSWKASIMKATARENDATVEVVIEVFRPNSPLSNPVSSRHLIFLLQKEDGKWMINSPSDLWWLY